MGTATDGYISHQQRVRVAQQVHALLAALGKLPLPRGADPFPLPEFARSTLLLALPTVLDVITSSSEGAALATQNTYLIILTWALAVGDAELLDAVKKQAPPWPCRYPLDTPREVDQNYRDSVQRCLSLLCRPRVNTARPAQAGTTGNQGAAASDGVPGGKQAEAAAGVSLAEELLCRLTVAAPSLDALSYCFASFQSHLASVTHDRGPGSYSATIHRRLELRARRATWEGDAELLTWYRSVPPVIEQMLEGHMTRELSRMVQCKSAAISCMAAPRAMAVFHKLPLMVEDAAAMLLLIASSASTPSAGIRYDDVAGWGQGSGAGAGSSRVGAVGDYGGKGSGNAVVDASGRSSHSDPLVAATATCVQSGLCPFPLLLQGLFSKHCGSTAQGATARLSDAARQNATQACVVWLTRHHSPAGYATGTHHATRGTGLLGKARLVAACVGHLWASVPLLPSSAFVQALLPSSRLAAPTMAPKAASGGSEQAGMDDSDASMAWQAAPVAATSKLPAPNGGSPMAEDTRNGEAGAAADDVDDAFAAPSGEQEIAGIAAGALREVMQALREDCACRELAECVMALLGTATHGPGKEGVDAVPAGLPSLLCAQACHALRQLQRMDRSLEAVVGVMQVVLEGAVPSGGTPPKPVGGAASTSSGLAPSSAELRCTLQLELLVALLQGASGCGGLLPPQPAATDVVRGNAGFLWSRLFAFLSACLTFAGVKGAPPLVRLHGKAVLGAPAWTTCLDGSLAGLAGMPTTASVTVGDMVAELLALPQVQAVVRCLRDLDRRIASRSLSLRELSVLLLADASASNGTTPVETLVQDQDEEAAWEDEEVSKVSARAQWLSLLLSSVPLSTCADRDPAYTLELYRACIRHRRQLRDQEMLLRELAGLASDHATWAGELGRKQDELATVTVADLSSPSYWDTFDRVGVRAAATRLRRLGVYSCFTYMQLWKNSVREAWSGPGASQGAQEQEVDAGTGEGVEEGAAEMEGSPEGERVAVMGGDAAPAAAALSLEACVDLLDSVERRFGARWQRLVSETDDATVADALLLWGGRQGFSLATLGHLASVDLDKELAIVSHLTTVTDRQKTRVRRHLSLFMNSLSTARKADVLLQVALRFLQGHAAQGGKGGDVAEGGVVGRVHDPLAAYDATVVKATRLLQLVGDTEAKLVDLSRATQDVEKVAALFTPLQWAVVEKLALANELLPLLVQLQGIDVRKLLDTVEEHSSACRGQAREMSVRALVSVKSFMQPLLLAFSGGAGMAAVVDASKKPLARRSTRKGKEVVGAASGSSQVHLHSLDDLLGALLSRMGEACGTDDGRTAGLAANIEICCNEVHSLRQLFLSLASRKQLVRDVAMQAAVGGRYQFVLAADARSRHADALRQVLGAGEHASTSYACTFLMHLGGTGGAQGPYRAPCAGPVSTESSGGASQSFTEAELMDYRGRALLAIHSVTSAEERKRALLAHAGADPSDTGDGAPASTSMRNWYRAGANGEFAMAEEGDSGGSGNSPTRVAAAMRAFVDDLTIASSVRQDVCQLAGLGHRAYQPPYRSQRVGGGEPLRQHAARVAGELAGWRALVSERWREHPFLRCFHPHQLRMLFPDGNAGTGATGGLWRGQALQWLRLAHPLASDEHLRELHECFLDEWSQGTEEGEDAAGYLQSVAVSLADALGGLPDAGLVAIPRELRGGAGVVLGLGGLAGLTHVRAADDSDESNKKSDGADDPTRDAPPGLSGHGGVGCGGGSGVAVLSLGPAEDMCAALLALYGWAGHWPSPQQLLMCDAATPWEEVDLLLLRCFHDPVHAEGNVAAIHGGALGNPGPATLRGLPLAASSSATCTGVRPLYAVVGVDALALDVQGRLVDRVILLRQQQLARSQGPASGCDGGATHKAGHGDRPQLVLVFGGAAPRGGGHTGPNSGGDQHSDYVAERAAQLGSVFETVSLLPETRGYARCLLSSRYGDRLSLVVSDRAGLGKSQHVMSRARVRNAQVSTVHLSGPLTRAEAVRRLACYGRLHPGLPPDRDDLHLDVACLDPAGLAVLDRLLAELFLTGCVRDRDAIFMLDDGRRIALELANSFSNGLAAGLTCPSLLASRTHLRWDPDGTLDASCGDIQLVCQHLAALDAGTLDTHEVECEARPALDRATCLRLLRRYILEERDSGVAAGQPSYSLLHAAVAVAARSFRDMSSSVFFRVDSLAFMEAPPSLRSSLARSLLHTARLFTLYSPRSPQGAQVAAQAEKSGSVTAAAAEEGDLASSLDMMGRLTRWEDCHYLLLLFNAVDTHTISALYRRAADVPTEVRLLLGSQDLLQRGHQPGTWRPPDYAAMTQEQLTTVLYRLLCPWGEGAMPVSQGGTGSSSSHAGPSGGSQPVSGESDGAGYVVTVDNVLKMALMYMRMRAGLPVLMMGETGCGKTSLVRRLARVVGAPFESLCLHAGTTEDDIIECVRKGEAACEALGDECEALVFLDEINTCDHLGLVASILCHRRLQGRAVDPRVRLLAACNPYRLQQGASSQPSVSSSTDGLGVEEGVTAAGLPGKLRRGDIHGRLEYRVHPLPDNLVHHVWDFGSLLPQHERAYVRAIVAEGWGHHVDAVVDALLTSHGYLRRVFGPSACSLRDPCRWVLLARWFLKSLKKRQDKALAARWPRWGVLGDVGRTGWRALSSVGSWAMSSRDSSRPREGEGGEEAWEEAGSCWMGPGSCRARLKPEVEAIILALAHCYLYRLNTRSLRQGYWEAVQEQISQLFPAGRRVGGTSVARLVMDVVEAEQREYLDRMVLPAGIAKNKALMETVFVMLVCILNRIPLFVVGRPGSGKSLAMHLIESNLRGPDSADPFFRTLPGLVTVSYQGSEASTSDGICKAFDRAHALLGQQNAGEEADLLPVVLLDEVGLAEVSQHNPLKVLHRLLEPPNGELPRVAVVGISNWALDASKMNRAVTLAHPNPDKEDLFHTAKAVWSAAVLWPNDASAGVVEASTQGDAVPLADPIAHQLRAIASAYYDHHANQAQRDFHGLRDFYSLLRDLSIGISSRALAETGFSSSSWMQTPMDPPSLSFAVARHFGGLSLDNVASIQEAFHQQVFPGLPFLTLFQPTRLLGVAPGSLWPSMGRGASSGVPPSTRTRALPSGIRLLDANLADPHARHLMLVTRGDAALALLLAKAKLRDPVVICGSRFSADQSEDSLYMLLNRIILCMETGRVLVLRDVDSVYGALYDLLNQHYTVIAGRAHCRIALGANSNPLCAVHPRFRCVVLMAQEKVACADPPFLNRFEKQLLTYESMLEQRPQLSEVLAHLRTWVADASCLQREYEVPLGGGQPRLQGGSGLSGPSRQQEHVASFGPGDMFPGFDEDTLPSLVLRFASDGGPEEFVPAHVVERCKQLLMDVATVESVLRLSHSELALRNPNEARTWQQRALAAGVQDSLKHLLQTRLAVRNRDVPAREESLQTQPFTGGGFRLLVRTFSNPVLNLTGVLQGLQGADGQLAHVTVHKLGIFKREAELREHLRQFWSAEVPAHPDPEHSLRQSQKAGAGAGRVPGPALSKSGSPARDSLLVLQVDMGAEGEHLQLALFLMEQLREEYLQHASLAGDNAAGTMREGRSKARSARPPGHPRGTKHVCVVLHLRRRNMGALQADAADQRGAGGCWPLNFLTEWEQATLDVLEDHATGDGADKIALLPDASLVDVLAHSPEALLPRVIQRLLPWCLLCIRSGSRLGDTNSANVARPAAAGASQSGASAERAQSAIIDAGARVSWLQWVRTLAESIAGDAVIMAAIATRLRAHLEEPVAPVTRGASSSRSVLPWLVATASDPRALAGHSSFQGSLHAALQERLRGVLARLLFAVADASAFASVFPLDWPTTAGDVAAVRQLWVDILLDPPLAVSASRVVSVDGVPPPDGLECYRPVSHLPLQVPFSALFFRRMEALRGEYVARFQQVTSKFASNGRDGCMEDDQGLPPAKKTRSNAGASSSSSSSSTVGARPPLAAPWFHPRAGLELAACREGLAQIAETSIPAVLLRAMRAFPANYMEDMCCLLMAHAGMTGGKAARMGAIYRWLLLHMPGNLAGASLGYLVGAAVDPIRVHVAVWEQGDVLVHLAELLGAASPALPQEPEGLIPAWQEWQQQGLNKGHMGEGAQEPWEGFGDEEVGAPAEDGRSLAAFVEDFVCCAVLPEQSLLLRLVDALPLDMGNAGLPDEPGTSDSHSAPAGSTQWGGHAATSHSARAPSSAAGLDPWLSLVENVTTSLRRLHRRATDSGTATVTGSIRGDSWRGPALLPALITLQDIAHAILASGATETDGGIMETFVEMAGQARVLKGAFLRTPEACQGLLALMDQLHAAVPGRSMAQGEHVPPADDATSCQAMDVLPAEGVVAHTGGESAWGRALRAVDSATWSVLGQIIAECHAGGEGVPYFVVKRIICERPPVSAALLVHAILEASPLDIVTMLADCSDHGSSLGGHDIPLPADLASINAALLELGQQRWQRPAGMLCDILSQKHMLAHKFLEGNRPADPVHGDGRFGNYRGCGLEEGADQMRLRALSAAVGTLLRSGSMAEPFAQGASQLHLPSTPGTLPPPLLIISAAALLRSVLPPMAASLASQWQQAFTDAGSGGFQPQGSALSILAAIERGMACTTGPPGTASPSPSTLSRRREAILIYLFKCLRAHLPMDQLRTLAHTLSGDPALLPSMRALLWSDDADRNRPCPWAEPFPLAYVPSFASTRATLASLFYSDLAMPEARQLMREAATSPASHMALGAALVERVFALRAGRPLTEREAHMVGWMRQQLARAKDPGDQGETAAPARRGSGRNAGGCILDWILATVTTHQGAGAQAQRSSSTATSGASGAFSGNDGGDVALPAYRLLAESRKLVCGADSTQVELNAACWMVHVALAVLSAPSARNGAGSSNGAPQAGQDPCACTGAAASPLHAYLCCGAGGVPWSDQYMLAGPSDERAAATNAVAVRERLGRYQCACGEIYFIGECMNPSQVARCSHCKAAIGGTGHNLLPNNRRADDLNTVEDQRGILAEDVSTLGNRFHQVRQLTAAGYRLLHAITQTCLLVGHAAGMHGNAPSLAGTSLTLLLERAHGHVLNDLNRLADALAISPDDAMLLAHATVARLGHALASGQLPPGPLTTPQQRNAWEAAFQAVCVRPLLDQPGATREFARTCTCTAQKLVAGASSSGPRDKPRDASSPSSGNAAGSNGNSARQAEMSLEGEIECTATPATAEYANARLLHLLRLPPPSTLATLQAHVMAQGHAGNAARSCPVLHALVAPRESPDGPRCHLDVLPRLALLKPLVRWAVFVSQEKGYQLTRAQAKSLTLGEFIASYKERSHEVMCCFNEFAAAWNQAGTFVSQYECQQLQPLSAGEDEEMVESAVGPMLPTFAAPATVPFRRRGKEPMGSASTSSHGDGLLTSGTALAQGVRIPRMGPELSLSHCCLHGQDEGIFLKAFLNYLMQIQNDFLQDVLASISSAGDDYGALYSHRVQLVAQEHQGGGGTGPGTGTGPGSGGQHVPRAVLALNAKSATAVEVEDLALCTLEEVLRWAEQHSHVVVAVEGDHGGRREFDLGRIELAVLDHCVTGRPCLELDDGAMFPFNGELFQGCANLLASVADTLPQAPFPQAHALQAHVGVGDSLPLLRPALDILLCHVRSMGRRCNPDQPLLPFASLLLPADLAGVFSLGPLAGAKLGHLVGIYEAVEDCLPEEVVAGVDPCYAQPLPEDVSRDVIRAVKSPTGIQPTAFARCLRRFLLRYLLQRRDGYKPDVAASLYLCNTELVQWPLDALKQPPAASAAFESAFQRSSEAYMDAIEEAFPETLLLEHTYQAYCLVKQA
eukprot:jgi/Mesvir1/5887/Mv00659-RA.1